MFWCTCVKETWTTPIQELMFQTAMSSCANSCEPKGQNHLTYITLIYFILVVYSLHDITKVPISFRYFLCLSFCLIPIVKGNIDPSQRKKTWHHVTHLLKILQTKICVACHEKFRFVPNSVRQSDFSPALCDIPAAKTR